jgi:hypothetical protein
MMKKFSKRTWIIIGAAVLVAVAVTATLLLMGEGKPYSKYDLTEYITVGEYTGLEVDGFAIAVTDEEVNTRIQENLTAAGTTNTVEEGVVADGETIIIDFAGKVDGQVFEGGSATDPPFAARIHTAFGRQMADHRALIHTDFR